MCRNYFKHRNYDPIKFEVFHENTNWVLEDEPTNWTMEELETFQNELAACTIQDQNDIGYFVTLIANSLMLVHVFSFYFIFGLIQEFKCM